MSVLSPVSRRFTSVTRWLLVVAGCTGLELVQPALAADPQPATAVAEDATSNESSTISEFEEPASSSAAERGGNTLLYPADGDNRIGGGAVAPADHLSTGWLLAGLVLVGAGVWVWLQRGRLPRRAGSARLIDIEETKSLGNRQFLVVAACDGRRFLLGVSPGHINTLADLDDLPTSAAVIPPAPEAER
ncbi:FliO/MopB family protein [Actomonas aquatica]|uniref:Flagellar biosynthetic protein FliO n=1 Tax=Actomonas aquatica TaxID=2866162 RepID=A0ABZ1CCG3_9BACT|nr:flagellar biosynthetic protein FliO [Opitutus sp. WL0086]WRQ89271.1 flagellar biosynthetic protein FliO [Opitutus sp. WL0086]